MDVLKLNQIKKKKKEEEEFSAHLMIVNIERSG